MKTNCKRLMMTVILAELDEDNKPIIHRDHSIRFERSDVEANPMATIQEEASILAQTLYHATVADA